MKNMMKKMRKPRSRMKTMTTEERMARASVFGATSTTMGTRTVRMIRGRTKMHRRTTFQL
jgi:hypothetical protein